MNCSESQKYLQDYLDRALSPEISIKIEEHLEICENCKAFLEELKVLQEFIRETDEPIKVPSEEYYQNVFKTSLAKSKASKSSFALSNLFPKIELYIQRFLFDIEPKFQWARSLSLLVVGFIIGISFFNNPSPNVSKIKPIDEISTSKETTPPTNPEVILSHLPTTPAEPDYLIKGLQKTIEIPGADLSKPQLSPSIPSIKSPSSPFPSPISHFSEFVNSILIPKSQQPTSTSQRDDDKLLRVASNIKNSDLLSELQNMKLNLYLSGDEKYIPDVHKVERVIYDIVLSDQNEKNYIETFKTYQKAEESLIAKQYFEAIKYYYEVARQNPDSLLAFLSYFQLGNIDFENLNNFRSALSNYEKCVEKFPSHFFSEEKKNLILSRIDLLTKNSQDNWQPLRLFLQAKSSQDVEKSKLYYQQLIFDYSASTLVTPAIQNLTNLTTADQEDNPIAPQEIIAFLQNCIDNNKFDQSTKEIIQLGIADIFNFRLKDSSQARIEYTRLMQMNLNSQLVPIAQSRIRRLNATFPTY